jgi:hypothetical protein
MQRFTKTHTATWKLPSSVLVAGVCGATGEEYFAYAIEYQCSHSYTDIVDTLLHITKNVDGRGIAVKRVSPASNARGITVVRPVAECQTRKAAASDLP